MIGGNEGDWWANRPRIRPAMRRDSVPKRPTWSPPTLPGGANLESPSGWLKYCRAARRGDDKFHLACCQMKHMHTAYLQRMLFVPAWYCHHPHPSGAPPFSAPQGARTWSHSGGELKFSPRWKPGGCPPSHLQLTEPRLARGGYTPTPAPLRAFLWDGNDW